MSATETRPYAWTVPVHVTDHGRWTPDDPRQAANLIATVNAWRKPHDPRPKVYRDYDGNTCLRVTIDYDGMTLEPGDHLVRLELPNAIEWSTPSPEDLAMLFPAEWPR